MIQLKRRTPVFLIALTWFELSPAAQALSPPPPPDGGYPSLNTAEGENALFKLTNGMLNTATITVRSLEIQPAISTQSAGPNTATSANALFLNDAGSVNTANGAEALYHNTTAFFNTAMGYQALPRQDLTSRRHLVGKEIRIWLVMVRWIPAKSGQTPPLVTPNF